MNNAYRWHLAALLLLCAPLLINPNPAISAEADPSPPPFALDDASRISSGRVRFNKTCAAYCHGSGGSGGRAPALNQDAGLSDAELFVTIRDGRRGSDIMPPWGNAFDEEQIWELVAYIRALQTAAPDTAPTSN